MATRYRCAACGNLTRFDVTKTMRTREYHHFTIAGDCNIDEREVIEEAIEEVRCRWCDRIDSIEIMDGQDTP